MPARDVFLGHAHLDKVEYARPLLAALRKHSVSVWLDDGELLPGMSITETVGEGLRNSQYVLLLITKRFLEQGWTQKELNAAFSWEVSSGVVMIIVILAIDHEVFAERYPLLVDKSYISWSDGVEAIAQRIADRFGRRPAADWHFNHPKEYVGPIWTRVLPQEPFISREHQVTLRWGPYVKRVVFTPGKPEPVSLVHHKTNPDDVTLHVHVDPPSIVTIGQGAAPDPSPANIDEGWTRAAGGGGSPSIP